MPPKEFMTWKETNGNVVIIKHDYHELTRYSHLHPGEIFVKVGQKVTTGDIVGKSGHTGWSIKPHLHFEVFLKHSNKYFQTLKIRWHD